MPAIKTQNLGINTAKEFIDSLSTADMNVSLYLTLSHVESWANNLAPDSPIDNMQEAIGIWRGMIGGKRITGNDVSPVIPRYDWTANTVYLAYSDVNPSALYGNNFYILTTDYNVYKCLANNSGANSTVMPTYTNVDRPNTEADGYTWKYMYTLSTSDRNRFLTPNWMPVRNLTMDNGSLQWLVQEAAIDGSVNIITMTNGGANYTNATNLSITFSGDGSSLTGTGRINTVSQTVSNIIVTNPGSGYHIANVTISGGAGSGATANAIISPFGGHGSSPVEELGGSNVLINVRLVADENGKLTVQNDYQQISIIKNPLVFGTSNAMSNSVFSQTYNVVLSAGFGSYQLDEFVFQGASLATSTFSGKVVDWDSSNNAMRLTETAGTPTTATLNGQSSGISRFVITTTDRDVQPFSGTILYVDNISAIQRANDSTDDIKIVFSY